MNSPASTALRISSSSLVRAISSCSMFESNQMLQFRPARFAEYMAMSDRRRHSSAVFPGSIREIPTDAETWTVAVPNGSGSAIDRMIAATDFETTLSPSGGARAAESSPPRGGAQGTPGGHPLGSLGGLFFAP